jgi:ornithine cyclodeaminase
VAIYLSEDDVRQVLTMPMALAAVKRAHRAHAAGQAIDVPRQRTRLPQTQLHILQGALIDEGVIGYKAYTSNRSGVRFLVHMFSAASGEPLAVIEANFLGMMRTGAASGVATKALARPDAAVAGLFGAGWQAEGHLRAIAAVRDLRQVKVFSRTPERCAGFCQRMSEALAIDVIPAASGEEAVRGSDIIGTVTTSSKPLFEADWLEAGTHINAAGSNALIRRELDERSVARADVVAVDSVAVALQESGDLFPLLEKGRLHAGQLRELGAVLSGQSRGRENREQLTLFESQGMAIQDLAIGIDVLVAAQAAGLGRLQHVG